MRSAKAFALAVLLTSGAVLADPPADAPLAIDVKKGQPAPDDGVFMTNARALATAKKCAQAAADRDHYRQIVADQPLPSGSLIISAGVVGVVIGVVIGGFVVALAKK